MAIGSSRRVAFAVIIGLAVGGLLVGGPAAAEDAGAPSPDAGLQAIVEQWAASMSPGPQHAELAATAGTWVVTTTVWMAPDAEPVTAAGTAVRTLLFDGRVLREDFSGEFEGLPFVGIGHTGYDNVTGTYWGTWMDNMMTGVVVLKGRRDEAGAMWIFEGEAPDPMAGGVVPLRIETRMDGRDREIDDFYKPGPDGTMFRHLQLVYERR